jgi:alpha-galactosidase
VALYNESETAAQITASAAALGLPPAAGYALQDVWSGVTTEAADQVSAVVPPHGTVIYRVARAGLGNRPAPATTALLTMPQAAQVAGHVVVKPGEPAPATATFGNYGNTTVRDVTTAVAAPPGWTVTPLGSTRAREVRTDRTASSSWTVRAPLTATPGTYELRVTTDYRWDGQHRAQAASTLTVLVAAPPPAGTSYLSDLAWLSATNAWGPVEKDTSNGEQAAGDGHTITVNGVTFAKGLGTNAPSEVDYYLGGGCTTVSAQVGIDDEKSANANATFQIFADGTKVADSGAMTFADDVRPLSGDVTGATVVRLVVDDNGSADSDHADWGDLKVTCA